MCSACCSSRSVIDKLNWIRKSTRTKSTHNLSNNASRKRTTDDRSISRISITTKRRTMKSTKLSKTIRLLILTSWPSKMRRGKSCRCSFKNRIEQERRRFSMTKLRKLRPRHQLNFSGRCRRMSRKSRFRGRLTRTMLTKSR